MTTLIGWVEGQWLTTQVTPNSHELIPPKDGRITFTPVLSHQVVLDPSSALPTGLVSKVISARLDDAGRLIGENGHQLPLPIGTYQVRYDFGRETWPSHDITVTEDHTTAAPLWIPAASPLPTAPRVVQIVTNEARLAAEMAAEMAEHHRDMADQFQRAAWQEAERAGEQVDLAADQVQLAREAVAGVEALNSLRVDTTVGTRVVFDHPGGTTMLYGDTGWRDMSSYFPPGMAGTFQARRRLHATDVKISVTLTADSPLIGTRRLPLANLVSDLPNSMFPSGGGYIYPLIMREGNTGAPSGTVMISYQTLTTTHLRVTSSSGGDWADGDKIQISGAIPNDQPWPTSQPGQPGTP